MQQLKPSTILQGGKYKIERVLGQGGFGITYSAVQVTLNRRVAIKEFFMKEYCERNADTSHVTLGTASGKELLNRFKEKFLKEAALIAQFDNPHIVRIYDIFEENNTAYYVMEFLEDRWSQFGKNGTPWELSLNIIKQVGDGLSYLHSQNVLHLDVKPSNIMFRKDCAVLIDFGISKRYDSQGGQTSTTPVGISKGFAPLEQYNQGVQVFQPATDIYSLGATLYKILTGETPPEASEVMNYGLPTEILRAKQVPEKIITVIQKSMESRVGQRYQSVSQLFDAIGETPKSATWGQKRTSFLEDDETTKLATTNNLENILFLEKTESQTINDNAESKKIINYIPCPVKTFGINAVSLGILGCIFLCVLTKFEVHIGNIGTSSSNPLFFAEEFIYSFLTLLMFFLFAIGIRKVNKVISYLAEMTSLIILVTQILYSQRYVEYGLTEFSFPISWMKYFWGDQEWALFYTQLLLILIIGVVIICHYKGNIKQTGFLLIIYSVISTLIHVTLFSTSSTSDSFNNKLYIGIDFIEIVWLYGLWRILTRKAKNNGKPF